MKHHYSKQRLLLLIVFPLLLITGSPIARAQWSALGSGIGDGYIEKIAVSGSNVYAVGNFTNKVLKWSGSSWQTVGNDPGGTVFCITVHGGDIYIGTNQGVKKLNGSNWDEVGNLLKVQTPEAKADVFALAVMNGVLYAGGNFILDGSTSMRRVAKLSGSAWEEVGGGFNGVVTTLSVRGDTLYAGGGFSQNGEGTQDLQYVAKSNGTVNWIQVGSGLSANTVQVIATSNTQVYVAGTSGATGLRKLNGSAWELIDGTSGVDIRALAIVGADLYVGGDFTTIGGISANRIARYNGTAWSALQGGLNNVCEAILPTSTGDGLYVGGYFTFANDGSADVTGTARIAKWTISGTYSYTNSSDQFKVVFQKDGLGTTPTVTIVKTGTTPPGGESKLPTETPQLEAISPYYWTVTCTNPPGLTFSNGRVSIPTSKIGGFSVYTNLRWLKRDGDNDTWTNIGGRVDDYGNLVSETPFTSLSQFAIGSIKGDDPLPVELAQFTLTPKNSGVVAAWKTASELDNLGFILSRAEEAGGTYQQIGSYLSHGSLKGQGTTASETSYAFGDYSALQPGQTYFYKLENVDIGGKRNLLEIQEIRLPEGYSLSQNYPNPFNPQTTIRFTMKEAGKAVLTVYDVLGRQVLGKQFDATAGVNEYNFNGAGLSTGLYFYRLKANGFDKTMKMMLLK